MECALVSLPSPEDQVRRVQAFPTQQSTNLPRLGTGVRLLENAQLVLAGPQLRRTAGQVDVTPAQRVDDGVQREPVMIEQGGVHIHVHFFGQAAHHFCRGHRVRVALSSAYWPIVWPSPEPVTLEMDATDSRLVLPIRPEHPQDGKLAEFEPVEGGPPLRCQCLAPSKSRWTIKTDLASGKQCHERQYDSGTCLITDYDWAFGTSNQRLFCIHPDNPLSAHCEIQTRQHYARGRWRIRIDSKVAMDVTKDTFNIRAELDAYEGDARVFSRNWSQRLPRDLV